MQGVLVGVLVAAGVFEPNGVQPAPASMSMKTTSPVTSAFLPSWRTNMKCFPSIEKIATVILSILEQVSNRTCRNLNGVQ